MKNLKSLFVVNLVASAMISFLLVGFLLYRSQPKTSEVIIDVKAETAFAVSAMISFLLVSFLLHKSQPKAKLKS